MQVPVLAMESTVATLSTSGPCQGDCHNANRSTEKPIIANPARLSQIIPCIEDLNISPRDDSTGLAKDRS